jgi:hypothetical protein
VRWPQLESAAPNAHPVWPQCAWSQLPHCQALVAKGAFIGGVLDTDDCRGTYETLKLRGVIILQEPVERPSGVEAVFRDDSGNWLSQTERYPPA